MVTKKKTWNQLIKPHLRKYTKLTNAIFSAHKAEVKRKGLKSIFEINKLWNGKYREKLNVIEKRMDREYKIIWTKSFRGKK